MGTQEHSLTGTEIGWYRTKSKVHGKTDFRIQTREKSQEVLVGAQNLDSIARMVNRK